MSKTTEGDDKIQHIVYLTTDQRRMIMLMTGHYMPNYTVRFWLTTNAGTLVEYGEKKERFTTHRIHWLEFVLCVLARYVIGDIDPQARKNKSRVKRRPYYCQIMGGQFGKSHPVEFLYTKFLLEKELKS